MSRKLYTSSSQDKFSLGEKPNNLLGEGDLAESFSDASDMSRQIRMRKKRKLPHIVTNKKSTHHRSFWPTYRGAVEWLRKRENDLNIALDLLELYPNLIQEAPMDGLWEFLQPLLSQLQNTIGLARTNNYFNGKSKVSFPETKSKSSNVPSICVTNPYGEANLPSPPDEQCLVYVCGNSTGEDQLSESLISLTALNTTQFLFTKTNFTNITREDDMRVAADISKSKVVVFVMSKATLEDPSAVKQLKVAQLHKVPVLFVRRESLSLPNPLPDFNSMELELLGVTERPMLQSRSRSVSPLTQSTSLDGKLESQKSSLRASMSWKGARSQSGRIRKKSSGDKTNNLSMLIMEGYRSAIVYDITLKEEFFEKLHEKLESLLQMPHSLFQRRTESRQEIEISPHPTPQPDNGSMHLLIPRTAGSFSGDDESGISEFGSYDEGLDQVFYDDLDNNEDWYIPERDSGLSSPIEKETTYVVYPAAESCDPAEAPKVVKWPPKTTDSVPGGRDVDPFNPFFDSPIGFENVNFDVILDSDSLTY